MVDRFNYARMKATANRLIKRFGKTTQWTLTNPRAVTGDPWNPTQASPVNYPVDCVVLNYRESDIDGERVLVGDRQVYIAVGDLEIKPRADWLLKGRMKGDSSDRTYKIVNINPLEPGDITLLWIAQCRAS